MSRSLKKNPIFGVTTAASEKDDKVRAHRRSRRLEKQALLNGNDLTDRRLTEDRDGYAKDGKVWRTHCGAKSLRK